MNQRVGKYASRVGDLKERTVFEFYNQRCVPHIVITNKGHGSVEVMKVSDLRARHFMSTRYVYKTRPVIRCLDYD